MIPEALPTLARLYALAVLDGQDENARALRTACDALVPGRDWLDELLAHTVQRYREDLRVAAALRARDAHPDPTTWRRDPQVLPN